MEEEPGNSSSLAAPASFGGSEGKTMLMFSGGRDSTLAAIRLSRLKRPLILVTVSSTHLFGFGRVRERLAELARVLPPETQWMRIIQPTELATDTSFYERTCLPCHHAYVVVSAILARQAGASVLAFGYASYQSDWPEQTPEAIESLRRVLRAHSIELQLPVHNLASRIAAAEELSDFGLSSAALEQKCSRQIENVRLSPEKLTEQVALWESAIASSIQRIDSIRIDVVSHGKLEEFL